jgi:hypothetical protein
MELREPRRRRTTLANLPHLREFLLDGDRRERPVLLRVGLDMLSKHLLGVVSTADDLAEATWFAQLGYRLLKEPRLSTRINHYAETAYHDLPKSPASTTPLFTIPDRLKTVLDEAAARGPFTDRRGVTSSWLRAAICYVAFVEKKVDIRSIPAHLFVSD